MRCIAQSALLGVLLGVCVTVSAKDPPTPGTVTNYTSPGNLASTHSLGCISYDKIRNEYTPADLYPAVTACVQQSREDDGVILYIVGSAYSQYDTLRVTDQTAYDAPLLVRDKAFRPLGEARMTLFQARIIASLQDDTKHLDICNKLLHLGPPRYVPRYMTQHGMNAFLKPDTVDQVKDIDPVVSWLKVMHDYTKCDVQLPKN